MPCLTKHGRESTRVRSEGWRGALGAGELAVYPVAWNWRPCGRDLLTI